MKILLVLLFLCGACYAQEYTYEVGDEIKEIKTQVITEETEVTPEKLRQLEELKKSEEADITQAYNSYLGIKEEREAEIALLTKRIINIKSILDIQELKNEEIVLKEDEAAALQNYNYIFTENTIKINNINTLIEKETDEIVLEQLKNQKFMSELELSSAEIFYNDIVNRLSEIANKIQGINELLSSL